MTPKIITGTTTPNLLYNPGKIHKVYLAALASIPLNQSLMKVSSYPRENRGENGLRKRESEGGK
jgi:hypothetical protein